MEGEEGEEGEEGDEGDEGEEGEEGDEGAESQAKGLRSDPHVMSSSPYGGCAQTLCLPSLSRPQMMEEDCNSCSFLHPCLSF